jgi:predicted protein tyrosine phosphatase
MSIRPPLLALEAKDSPNSRKQTSASRSGAHESRQAASFSENAYSDRQSMKSKAKLAYFKSQCTEILDFLYVGGKQIAQDKNLLRSYGITHIVNCAGDVCENYHEGDFTYMRLFLLDSASEDILSVMYDVYEFIDTCRRQGGKALIHCQQGVSRSTMLVIGYLMLHSNANYEECYQFVRSRRGVCRPNVGFMCQLLSWRKRCTGVPERPTLYRLGPHCSRDRDRVVAKWYEGNLLMGADWRSLL